MRGLVQTSVKVLGIVIMLICCAFNVGQPDINAKVKAIFLYNFSKYVEWPESMASGRFKIGIYGNYPQIREELIKMSKIKRRGDRSFEIINFSSVEAIVPTHILYVVKNNDTSVEAISEKIKNSPTLLVTEENGSIDKGADINLYYENNKQKIELNPENFDARGLKVSSQLISIAKVVNG